MNHHQTEIQQNRIALAKGVILYNLRTRGRTAVDDITDCCAQMGFTSGESDKARAALKAETLINIFRMQDHWYATAVQVANEPAPDELVINAHRFLELAAVTNDGEYYLVSAHDYPVVLLLKQKRTTARTVEVDTIGTVYATGERSQRQAEFLCLALRSGYQIVNDLLLRLNDAEMSLTELKESPEREPKRPVLSPEAVEPFAAAETYFRAGPGAPSFFAEKLNKALNEFQKLMQD